MNPLLLVGLTFAGALAWACVDYFLSSRENGEDRPCNREDNAKRVTPMIARAKRALQEESR